MFVPQAYAQEVGEATGGCNTGSESLNLANCFRLNPTTLVSDIYSTPADLINIIVGAIFVFGGFVLFLTIFYAGFKFIQSGTKGKDEAKTMITNALVGFIIMFVAYWIVKIVEIVTGVEIIF